MLTKKFYCFLLMLPFFFTSVSIRAFTVEAESYTIGYNTGNLRTESPTSYSGDAYTIVTGSNGEAAVPFQVDTDGTYTIRVYHQGGGNIWYNLWNSGREKLTWGSWDPNSSLEYDSFDWNLTANTTYYIGLYGNTGTIFDYAEIVLSGEVVKTVEAEVDYWVPTGSVSVVDAPSYSGSYVTVYTGNAEAAPKFQFTTTGEHTIKVYYSGGDGMLFNLHRGQFDNKVIRDQPLSSSSVLTSAEFTYSVADAEVGVDFFVGVYGHSGTIYDRAEIIPPTPVVVAPTISVNNNSTAGTSEFSSVDFDASGNFPISITSTPAADIIYFVLDGTLDTANATSYSSGAVTAATTYSVSADNVSFSVSGTYISGNANQFAITVSGGIGTEFEAAKTFTFAKAKPTTSINNDSNGGNFTFTPANLSSGSYPLTLTTTDGDIYFTLGSSLNTNSTTTLPTGNIISLSDTNTYKVASGTTVNVSSNAWANGNNFTVLINGKDGNVLEGNSPKSYTYTYSNYDSSKIRTGQFPSAYEGDGKNRDYNFWIEQEGVMVDLIDAGKPFKVYIASDIYRFAPTEDNDEFNGPYLRMRDNNGSNEVSTKIEMPNLYNVPSPDPNLEYINVVEISDYSSYFSTNNLESISEMRFLISPYRNTNNGDYDSWWDTSWDDLVYDATYSAPSVPVLSLNGESTATNFEYSNTDFDASGNFPISITSNPTAETIYFVLDGTLDTTNATTYDTEAELVAGTTYSVSADNVSFSVSKTYINSQSGQFAITVSGSIGTEFEAAKTFTFAQAAPSVVINLAEGKNANEGGQPCLFANGNLKPTFTVANLSDEDAQNAIIYFSLGRTTPDKDNAITTYLGQTTTMIDGTKLDLYRTYAITPGTQIDFSKLFYNQSAEVFTSTKNDIYLKTTAVWGSTVDKIRDFAFESIKNVNYEATTKTLTLTYDQFDKVGADLEYIVGQLGYLPNNASNLGWYMEDAFVKANNPSVFPEESTVFISGSWRRSKYQAGYHPWINTNIAHSDAYTYYVVDDTAYSNINDANGDYLTVNVIVNPVAPNQTDYVDLFTEDFGSGSEQFGPSVGTKTTYDYNDAYLPDANQYSIINSLSGVTQTWGGTPDDWDTSVLNHTMTQDADGNEITDADGYMYIVNASENNAGVFYEYELDLCENIEVQFSIWLRNICTGYRSSDQYAPQTYRIKPNVNIQVLSGEEIVAEVWTGDVEMNAEWQPYYFSIMPRGGSNVKLRFNNVNQGGEGNDFMIDDIAIRMETGAIQMLEVSTPESGDQLQVGFDHAKTRKLYYNLNDKTSDNKIYYYYMLETPDGQKIISGQTRAYDFDLTNLNENNFILSDWNQNGTARPLQLTEGTYRLYLLPQSSDDMPVASDFGSTCNPECTYFYEEKYGIIPQTETERQTAYAICYNEDLTLTLDPPSNINIADITFQWGYLNDAGQIVLFDDSTNDQPFEQVYDVALALDGVADMTHVTYLAKITEPAVGEELAKNYYTYIRITRKGNAGAGVAVVFGSEGYTTPQDATYTIQLTYQDNFTSLAIPVQQTSGIESVETLTLSLFDESNNAVALDGATVKISNDGKYFNLSFATTPVTVEQFRSGVNELKFRLSYEDNSSAGCTFSGYVDFNVTLISRYSVWTPQNGSTNWNDSQNWIICSIDTEGNLDARYANAAGVPNLDTHVILPGNSDSYPSLNEEAHGVTDDGFNPNLCNSITFEMGAELNRQDLLSYYKAFVEIDYGPGKTAGKSTSAYFLERGRFYLMTAPLKDMYSGDFFFGGLPKVYMRHAQVQKNTGTGENSSAIALNDKISIATAIANYNIALPAGYGFAYVANTSNSDNLVKNNGVVRYPRFEDEKFGPYGNLPGAVATGEDYGFNHWESYASLGEGLGGTTTFNYYKTSDVKAPSTKKDQVVRTSEKVNINGRERTVLAGNRFVANAAVTVAQTSDVTIVGNPFMAPLDFAEFYNGNSVKPYYYLYDGKTLITYSYDSESGTVTSTDLNQSPTANHSLIAPMQSFFAEFSNSVELSPSMTNLSIDKKAQLRNAVIREELKVTVANDDYSSTVAIISNNGSQDLMNGVPKIFTNTKGVPELYIADNTDKVKAIVEVNEKTERLPLGIKTENAGEVLELSFMGVENFPCRLSLLDNADGTIQPIGSGFTHSFVNTEEENRFYILFSIGDEGDITGNEDINDEKVQIYPFGKTIVVNSSSFNLIETVKVYDTAGLLLIQDVNIQDGYYRSGSLQQGIYIVEVMTQQGISRTRVIVK